MHQSESDWYLVGLDCCIPRRIRSILHKIGETYSLNLPKLKKESLQAPSTLKTKSSDSLPKMRERCYLDIYKTQKDIPQVFSKFGEPYS